MKKTCTLFLLPLLLICCSLHKTNAQCADGYNKVTLNWDYLDYYTYAGNYTNGYLPGFEWALTQRFSFGANLLTIEVPFLRMIQSGENTSHDAHNGSYAGDGADVQFLSLGIGTTEMTLRFDQEVRNLQFSIYDLDINQRLNVSAENAAGNNCTVSLSRANSGSNITLLNNPGNSPQARAAGNSYNNNDNRGTVNIDISGPVKTITLSFSNALGDFWLSDISACSPGSFPVNYYGVSRPISGQPAYVLHAIDNDVYALNPATGVSKFIFSDPNVPGNGYINSMAYDPYRKILYYTYSHTRQGPPRRPGGNKMLKKYDLNTKTISTVLSDITDIGIPVSDDYGVESGGAAFYNGNLYLGIAATDNSQRSSRESVIWRIDFTGAGAPYRASQVFALPADNGAGTLLNHWSDFVINNGMLYNFDGATIDGNQTDIYQFNLQTGNATVFSAPTFTPGQTAIDWSGTIYQVQANANNGTLPYVAVYNPSNATIGTPRTITAMPVFTPPIPEIGDAAEAYRPPSDFGDAPASYSPDPFAAAAHETTNNLRLGSAQDLEWDGMSSAIADADGADEDGIGAAPALAIAGRTTYTVDNISVYNNTGLNATLVGWLDYNFNGAFEPEEGLQITLPSSSQEQLVSLSWNNIQVPVTAQLRTFLRLRVTSASHSMTTASVNGWFANGEVEDYPVVIGTVLHGGNSPTVPLTPNSGNNEAPVKLLPNPAVNYTAVQLYADGNTTVEVQLIDNSGKILVRVKSGVQRGVNHITLNRLHVFPPGVYCVRIFMDGKAITTPLVIGK